MQRRMFCGTVIVFATIFLPGWIPSGWAIADARPSAAGEQANQSSRPRNRPPNSAARPPASEPAPSSVSSPPGPKMSQELISQPGPYLRSKLGIWTPAHAEKEFGEPIRHRFSKDERGAPLADIWAYKHPRYVQVELSFSRQNQRLTDVYFYPVNLTWTEAKTLFGENYQTTRNKDGSAFYSYREARTNLLVSQSDKVISIGIY